MDHAVDSALMAAKLRIKQTQKAWKYIRDIHNVTCGDLNQPAILDGNRTYTYSAMFRMWERYAAVFTELGMTDENKSRVGLIGSTAAETIFSIYGLNMTGAEVSLISSLSSLRTEKVVQTIREENLTDFIVPDDTLNLGLFSDLLKQKDELGLRNILLLHIPLRGSSFPEILSDANDIRYQTKKAVFPPLCMENLLKTYGNGNVHYAPFDNSDSAFILHTSGTVSGTGKPVVISDKALNAALGCFMKQKVYEYPDDRVSSLSIDLSNSYGFVDQVHAPFGLGSAVVIVPYCTLNPWFYKAIPEYKMTFLFSVSALLEQWMKLPDSAKLDFSTLKVVVLGGAYVSATDKKRYHEFLTAHGAKDLILINGYGESELGGACCLSSSDLDDESIGVLMPGFDYRLYDEEEDCFRSPKDAPCTGVLYLNSGTMATATLDGKTTTEIVKISGKPFINTNDLVSVDEDGKFSYLGRANRCFVNNSGAKYESGRVETEIQRSPAIESCGVVPVYHKQIHDSIPQLCVKLLEPGDDPAGVIRGVLLEVFRDQKTLEPANLPARVLIADDLPRNANGKIDLFRITQGAVSGETYRVNSVQKNKEIVDILLERIEEEKPDMIKDAMDDIKADLKANLSINNLFKEAMNTMSQNPFGFFNTMNQMCGQMMNMKRTQMMNRLGKQQDQPAQNPGFNMMPFAWMAQQRQQQIQQNMQQIQQNMQELQQLVQQYMQEWHEYIHQMHTAEWQALSQMADYSREWSEQVNTHRQERRDKFVQTMQNNFSGAPSCDQSVSEDSGDDE